MKVLVQRVKKAAVEVEGKTVAKVSAGILVFIGVENKIYVVCWNKT